MAPTYTLAGGNMKKPLTFKSSRKDRKPKISTFLTVLLLLFVVSGCGLAFIDGPAAGWESSSDLETIALTQPCTNSKGLVAVDGIVSALFLATGAAWTQNDEWDEYGFDVLTNSSKNENAAYSFAVGAIPLTGAIVGNKRVNECRQFNAKLLEQRRGNGRFSVTSADEDNPITTTSWIESLGASPLPKTPYKK